MLLPGPEAQQLATYIGWLLHRTWGGIAAGVLFVLPAVIILWLLSWCYVVFGQVPAVTAVFHGLKAAVLAIVVSATIRIGRRVLKNSLSWTIAAAAFLAIFVLNAPFPLIILGAGTAGLVAGWWRPGLIGMKPHAVESEASVPAADVTDEGRGWIRALRVIATCLLMWWLPWLALFVWLGGEHAIVREGVFFSKAALVTFGGAYAVLPYVGQQAVETHGWLSATQMMDGLGLAETTPGPLVMVLQFVGFVGGWQHPGSLPPLLAATLGAGITTWVRP
jgi:chromate transporter